MRFIVGCVKAVDFCRMMIKISALLEEVLLHSPHQTFSDILPPLSCLWFYHIYSQWIQKCTRKIYLTINTKHPILQAMKGHMTLYKETGNSLRHYSDKGMKHGVLEKRYATCFSLMNLITRRNSCTRNIDSNESFINTSPPVACVF